MIPGKEPFSKISSPKTTIAARSQNDISRDTQAQVNVQRMKQMHQLPQEHASLYKVHCPACIACSLLL